MGTRAFLVVSVRQKGQGRQAWLGLASLSVCRQAPRVEAVLSCRCPSMPEEDKVQRNQQCDSPVEVGCAIEITEGRDSLSFPGGRTSGCHTSQI